VYHPADRDQLNLTSIAFRADQSSGRLRENLRNLAISIDPRLELQDIRTLDQIYEDQA
jgi:hypothetical protein